MLVITCLWACTDKPRSVQCHRLNLSALYTALEWLEDDPLGRKKHGYLKAGVEKGATAGKNMIAITHAIAMSSPVSRATHELIPAGGKATHELIPVGGKATHELSSPVFSSHPRTYSSGGGI